MVSGLFLIPPVDLKYSYTQSWEKQGEYALFAAEGGGKNNDNHRKSKGKQGCFIQAALRHQKEPAGERAIPHGGMEK